MAIFQGNEALLIAAPMLQDLLVDENGIPLTAGIVTMAQDNDHNILKNWYYQTGPSGGPYQYITLSNPMTLSGAGTITDPNGNDTIPFYYPYASDNETYQPYFVTVQNSDLQTIFTRDGFPFVGNPGEASSGGLTNDNYIINNRFWRNIGSANVGTIPASQTWTTQYNSTGTYYYQTLAPSNFDGFSMPDFNFIKTANGDTERIDFNVFPHTANPVFTNDIRPEFYITYTLSNNVSGSAFRIFQFPIVLHVDNLQAQPFSFTIQAMSTDGSPAINIQIYQFNGTNANSPAPFVEGTIEPTSTWTKFVLNNDLTFPAISSPSLSAAGDDAFYIQIAMPTNGTYNVSFAIPSLYLNGTSVPSNSFQTYDQIDRIISLPRTGDLRTSINTFSPWGWVNLNDTSTIGASSSTATYAGTESWPLYYLLWNTVNNNFAPVAGGRGANAFNDFTANKKMTLTLALGRTFIGLPPAMNVESYNLAAPAWNSGFAGYFVLVTGTSLLYPGSPVVLTGTNLNAAFTSGTTYYAIPDASGVISDRQFQLAATYADAIAKNAIVASGVLTGTGILITFALGGYFGESRHEQLLAEVVGHTHDPAIGTAYWYVSGAADTGAGVSAALDSASTTGDVTRTTSGTYPMNIIQPVTYMNFFMKL